MVGVAKNLNLVVNEIFGPTIQGEGPSTGQRAFFVRLGGCPLACVWCDSAYTWDWDEYSPLDELHPLPIDSVAHKLIELGLGLSSTNLLVITGGEPMVQQRGIVALLNRLDEFGYLPQRVEIETAGIISPNLNLLTFPQVHFNVSPKLENSGNLLEKRLKPEILREFVKTDRAIFKFVVVDSSFSEVIALLGGSGIPDRLVWIQPEGITSEAIINQLQEIAPEAIRLGWNISPRLHVLIWGNKRSR